MRDEARRRYEKFYANDVRRLGRKQADKKWKNTDSLKTPLKLKRDTNGEKIATALALGWLSVGDGFPGFCFISDRILATILGLMLPLPSLMAKNDDADNQRGRKI